MAGKDVKQRKRAHDALVFVKQEFLAEPSLVHNPRVEMLRDFWLSLLGHPICEVSRDAVWCHVWYFVSDNGFLMQDHGLMLLSLRRRRPKALSYSPDLWNVSCAWTIVAHKLCSAFHFLEYHIVGIEPVVVVMLVFVILVVVVVDQNSYRLQSLRWSRERATS